MRLGFQGTVIPRPLWSSEVRGVARVRGVPYSRLGKASSFIAPTFPSTPRGKRVADGASCGAASGPLCLLALGPRSYRWPPGVRGKLWLNRPFSGDKLLLHLPSSTDFRRNLGLREPRRCRQMRGGVRLIKLAEGQDVVVNNTGIMFVPLAVGFAFLLRGGKCAHPGRR